MARWDAVGTADDGPRARVNLAPGSDRRRIRSRRGGLWHATARGAALESLGVDTFDVVDGKDDPKLTTVILTASGGP